MASILDSTGNWQYFKYNEEENRTYDGWGMGNERKSRIKEDASFFIWKLGE